MSCTRPPVVVLTRAQGDNAAFALWARQRGVVARELPCLATTQLTWGPAHAAAMAALPTTHAIAFASRAGVAATAALMRHHAKTAGAAAPALPALYAVGPATAAAVHHTFSANAHVPAVHSGAGLLALMAQHLGNAPQNLLLPAAQHGRRELADGLRVLGHAVNHLVVYATQPAPARTPKLAWGPGLHVVVCTSPSGVAGFFAQAQTPAVARFLSIGPTTTAALVAHGVPVYAEATRHNAAGVLALLALALEPT